MKGDAENKFEGASNSAEEKSEGVLSALKGRKSLGGKKDKIKSIVKKLTDKAAVMPSSIKVKIKIKK